MAKVSDRKDWEAASASTRQVSTQKGTKTHKDLAELVANAEDDALDVSTNKQLKHLRKLAKAIIAADEDEA